MTQLIRSEHTDTHGYAFAGQILAWMDICAGVAAKRHAGTSIVTAAVDAVHFFNPVRINNICIITANVNRTWKSSMEVGVHVEAEDMLTDRSPVPTLLPTSMNERRRYHEAQERRERRLSQPRRQIIQPCLPHNPKDVESGYEEDSPKRNSFTNSLPRNQTSKERINVNCSDTYTEVFEILFPEHCNEMGIAFGGQIMKWMEFAAAISANRFCRSDLLVVSIDSLNFRESTNIGDIVTVRAMVSANYDHSVEVYCTVEKEAPDGTIRVTNDGWMTFVSIEGGKPKMVPFAIADSKLEKERQRDAASRKERRLKEVELIKSYAPKYNSEFYVVEKGKSKVMKPTLSIPKKVSNLESPKYPHSR